MRRFSLLIYFFIFSLHSFSQSDTAHLKEVEVKTKNSNQSVTSSLPVQSVDKDFLEKISGENIVDAVKYFSGVQVKDYGGVGGLKTISVRGLNTNHSGISYDGIMLNDAQNGQIDLGKLSLTDIEEISLYNAQSSNILQPARNFSYASILNLKTINPNFSDSEKVKLNVAFKTGSFGMVNPSTAIYYKINKRIYNSISSELQDANGAYSFTYKNDDSTVKARRSNSDIHAYRLEYKTVYNNDDSNIVDAHVYYYQSKRELPGAIIFYAPQGTQRMWDNNFFAQIQWKRKINEKRNLLVSAKYNYSYNDYLDTLRNFGDKFQQREWYGSAAYQYNILYFLKVAIASDIFYGWVENKDSAFIKNYGMPNRISWLNNLSTELKFPQLQIAGNFLSSSIQTKVFTNYASKNYQSFSPTISFIYQPVKNFPFRLRAFYKNIFRMPTFNDLYYSVSPNPNIQPENAKQFNFGITWNKKFSSRVVKNILLTVDAYHNHIKNMIVARPGTDIETWNISNYGLVSINGIEFNLKIYSDSIGKFQYKANGSFTLQQALNTTDPTSQIYKNQIPYMPKQFGSVNFIVDYKKLSFSYNTVFSGYRYSLDQNISDNLLNAWSTQDIAFNYIFHTNKKNTIRLFFRLNNIFNNQYQIVQYYPMPGRNFDIGFQFNI